LAAGEHDHEAGGPLVALHADWRHVTGGT
jgi:hypothetical protein